jgi:hypothetical protein
MMANNDIKKEIEAAGLFQYQVAHELGVKSDATFTKWLRYELSGEKKEMIRAAIKKLSVIKGR